jgi:hypothetical protein
VKAHRVPYPSSRIGTRLPSQLFFQKNVVRHMPKRTERGAKFCDPLGVPSSSGRELLKRGSQSTGRRTPLSICICSARHLPLQRLHLHHTEYSQWQASQRKPLRAAPRSSPSSPTRYHHHPISPFLSRPSFQTVSGIPRFQVELSMLSL